jgi:hypothetical protein
LGGGKEEVDKMAEQPEEKKDPNAEIEKFVDWLKADWSHIALVILGILFVVVLIVLLTRRR